MNIKQKVFLVLLIGIVSVGCNRKNDSINLESEVTSEELKIKQQRQDSIIEKYLTNGAKEYSYYSKEWHENIDKGLAVDSTIAYLWQQKAMPYFKQSKYEVGMEYIDKAVKYDRRRWQDYRAFIKCIFAKTYRDAIKGFKDYKKRYGYSYVMDHSYDFYIALSYLQLNEFEKAEEIFKKDHEKQLAENGKDWLHHIDLFYYAISKYEQGKYTEAIELFDMALEIHTQFSDAQAYKALCLRKLGKIEEAQELHSIAYANGKQGLTINEDNAVYERYPYQIRWH
ncbi:tetratricopeptide repeat protein [Galbibacter sp. EGI 63066]|uniref:tetratricopeptide repeat protein n=1 Tax=Galbibacter sp. EGI 63066 TaxID=2993559 RepID=UPI00224928C6|nr:tetratricopeptide repeat protein [Galbibacter sp. EGI 63066]MCX2681726.1 tetratricopeptide repeat protein [Galbibacter sp. EGI 63066]